VVRLGSASHHIVPVRERKSTASITQGGDRAASTSAMCSNTSTRVPHCRVCPGAAPTGLARDELRERDRVLGCRRFDGAVGHQHTIIASRDAGGEEAMRCQWRRAGLADLLLDVTERLLAGLADSLPLVLDFVIAFERDAGLASAFVRLAHGAARARSPAPRPQPRR